MTHQKIYDYKQIHHDAIVIDGHNDVSQRLINGEDIGKRTSKGHIDLERMKDGGVDAAIFSVWVPPEKKLPPYFNQANQQGKSLLLYISQGYFPHC